MKKDTGSVKKSIDYIAKQVSDGVYINVTRLPNHKLNYEELEESFRKERESTNTTEKPLRTENEENGNETIGIP